MKFIQQFNKISFVRGIKRYFDVKARSISGECSKTHTNTRVRVFVINNSIETISSLANWMTTDYDVYVEPLNHGFPNFKITHSI